MDVILVFLFLSVGIPNRVRSQEDPAPNTIPAGTTNSSFRAEDVTASLSTFSTACFHAVRICQHVEMAILNPPDNPTLSIASVVCNLRTSVYQCLQVAKFRCQVQGQENVQDLLDAPIQRYKALLDTKCQVSNVNVTCSGAGFCMDTNFSSSLANGFEGKESSDVCLALMSAYPCLGLVQMDCLEQRTVEAIAYLKNITQDVQDKLDTLCLDEDEGKYDCRQLSSCVTSTALESFQAALSEGDFGKACLAQISMKACLDSTIADCRNFGLIRGAFSSLVETFTTNLESKVETLCPSSSNATGCHRPESCHAADQVDFKANKPGGFPNACQVLTSTYQCFMTADEECGGQTSIDVTLRNMSQRVQTMSEYLCPFFSDKFTCVGLGLCLNDLRAMYFTKAIHKADFRWLCQYMGDLQKCVTNVRAVCTRKGSMNNESMGFIEDASAYFQIKADEHCQELYLKTKCLDAQACKYVLEMTGISNDTSLARECEMLSRSHRCMNSAIGDCESRGLLKAASYLKVSTNVFFRLRQIYCHEGTTNSGCFFPIAKCFNLFQYNAISEHDTESVCQHLVSIHQCMLSSTENCKKAQVITAHGLQDVEYLTKVFENETKEFCQTQTAVLVSVACSSTDSCGNNSNALQEKKEDEMDNSCDTRSPSDLCFGKSTLDCQNFGSLSDAALAEFEKAKPNLVGQMKAFCSGAHYQKGQRNGLYVAPFFYPFMVRYLSI